MADSITSLVNETLPSGNSLTRAEVLDYIDVGRSPGGSEVSPSTGRDIRSEAAGLDWPTPTRLCTQEAKLVFNCTRQNNVKPAVLPAVQCRPQAHFARCQCPALHSQCPTSMAVPYVPTCPVTTACVSTMLALQHPLHASAAPCWA